MADSDSTRVLHCVSSWTFTVKRVIGAILDDYYPRLVFGSWTSSVYHASSAVSCDLQQAWNLLLHYERWNPGFSAAETTTILGERGFEGEIVRIKSTALDNASEELFAETLRVNPPFHIVWQIFPVDGDAYLKFLTFMLVSTPTGLIFEIFSYECDRLHGAALAQHRVARAASLEVLASAFAAYCR